MAKNGSARRKRSLIDTGYLRQMEANMKKNILGKIIAAGALVAFVAPASAQSIDPNFYYKLSTRFRGPGMKLDVFNGGARNNLTHLEPDQDVSGQFWRFRENADGTFRLSTLFRGPSMCLDIFNGGPRSNQPHLDKCANLTGQFWFITVTETTDAVRLTTRFRGPGMCLDIFNGGPDDNQPHLAQCPDLSGQLWLLTKTDRAVESAKSE
jgi:hypothetical protein